VTIRFDPRITLGGAWALLDNLFAEITACCPGIDSLAPAGDVRRVEPVVGGIVVVGLSDDPGAALDSIAGLGTVEQVLHRADRRAHVVYRHSEIDVRVAAPDDYGSVLFEATGSPRHVRAVSERRRHNASCRLEEEVYAEAGLPYIAPELRQGSREIEAALSGRLPSLVERRHIRGDLHMHSDYSDGQDPIAAMVDACRAIGYEYIAITDHSENAGASRTLRANQIPRQRAEIERLRELHPEMAILHGVEVDVLPDGRLDFDDDVLEQFDIVLASLHDRAGQDGARLTRRCLSAIRHPLVNVLAHPSNQLVGRRPGYPLDYEAVYAAAAETGTALEVDGGSSHLDLDGEHARDAVEAGATLVIDSDCHRAVALERQMMLGVGTARRGAVEARHVLNTRSLEDVRRFVERKRSGNG
jgi:DNA polymerase (family 10)